MLEISIFNKYGKVIHLIVFSYLISSETNINCHKDYFPRIVLSKFPFFLPQTLETRSTFRSATFP